MKIQPKYYCQLIVFLCISFISDITYASEWMDCTPYRVAARNNGNIHVGCENIAGWYYVKSDTKNKDYIDRILYLATSAITAKKSLKLEVAKSGKDSEITAIELFK